MPHGLGSYSKLVLAVLSVALVYESCVLHFGLRSDRRWLPFSRRSSSLVLGCMSLFGDFLSLFRVFYLAGYAKGRLAEPFALVALVVKVQLDRTKTRPSYVKLTRA